MHGEHVDCEEPAVAEGRGAWRLSREAPQDHWRVQRNRAERVRREALALAVRSEGGDDANPGRKAAKRLAKSSCIDATRHCTNRLVPHCVAFARIRSSTAPSARDPGSAGRTSR